MAIEPSGPKKFKNLSESTSQTIYLNSEFENQSVKLKFTMKSKKEGDDKNEKNKYDLNNIFGKVKAKKSVVSNILDDIKESESGSNNVSAIDDKRSIIDNEESKRQVKSKVHSNIFAAKRLIGANLDKVERITLRDDVVDYDNVDKF